MGLLNSEKDPGPESCEHEVDEDAAIEYGDIDDIFRWGAPMFYMSCKKCKCRGTCVDDDENYWDDKGDGNFY